MHNQKKNFFPLKSLSIDPLFAPFHNKNSITWYCHFLRSIVHCIFFNYKRRFFGIFICGWFENILNFSLIVGQKVDLSDIEENFFLYFHPHKSQKKVYARMTNNFFCFAINLNTSKKVRFTIGMCVFPQNWKFHYFIQQNLMFFVVVYCLRVVSPYFLLLVCERLRPGQKKLN